MAAFLFLGGAIALATSVALAAPPPPPNDQSQWVGAIANAAAPTYGEGEKRGLSQTLGGALRVSSSGGSTTITSVTPGTGATNLGKAEDAAHTSGDVGVMDLGVANADGTDFAAAGDYVPAARTVDGVSKTIEQVGTIIDETGAVLTITRQRNVTNLASGAEVTIRAAQGAGVEIIVVGWILSVDTAATLRFESDDGAETAIGPDVYLSANGGWTSDYTQLWFETASNGALELENGGASTINVGWTVYTVQR